VHLANFWFGFRFSHLKTLQFFGFGVLCGLHIFSYVVVGFQLLSTVMAVFRIFLPNVFYGFSGFANVTSHSRAKTVVPRDHLQLGECMISLLSLAAVIWVVMAAKQTMKS